MRAGKLREQLTIEQSTQTADGIGGQIDTWSTVAVVWAAVETDGGREFDAAAAVNAELTHLVRLRYRAGVSPKMRLLWDGRYLNILAVINVDDVGRELRLMCKERVS